LPWMTPCWPTSSPFLNATSLIFLFQLTLIQQSWATFDNPFGRKHHIRVSTLCQLLSRNRFAYPILSTRDFSFLLRMLMSLVWEELSLSF
jgi:hypothetical protein